MNQGVGRPGGVGCGRLGTSSWRLWERRYGMQNSQNVDREEDKIWSEQKKVKIKIVRYRYL